MYEETKIAVKKALEVGKILFSMGATKFEKLATITNNIVLPSREEIEQVAKTASIPFEKAHILCIKKRYKQVAVSAGFTEEEGLAMLTYASLLEDIK